MPNRRSHVYRTHIEFEDVDSGGVLHHPKYLNLYERARVSFLRDRGLSFKEMLDSGQALAVRDLQISYLKPLYFEDEVTILTQVVGVRPASLQIAQAMLNRLISDDDKGLEAKDWGRLGVLNQMNLHLVYVSLQNMTPIRFSDEQFAALGI